MDIPAEGEEGEANPSPLTLYENAENEIRARFREEYTRLKEENAHLKSLNQTLQSQLHHRTKPLINEQAPTDPLKPESGSGQDRERARFDERFRLLDQEVGRLREEVRRGKVKGVIRFESEGGEVREEGDGDGGPVGNLEDLLAKNTHLTQSLTTLQKTYDNLLTTHNKLEETRRTDAKRWVELKGRLDSEIERLRMVLKKERKRGDRGEVVAGGETLDKGTIAEVEILGDSKKVNTPRKGVRSKDYGKTQPLPLPPRGPDFSGEKIEVREKTKLTVSPKRIGPVTDQGLRSPRNNIHGRRMYEEVLGSTTEDDTDKEEMDVQEPRSTSTRMDVDREEISDRVVAAKLLGTTKGPQTPRPGVSTVLQSGNSIRTPAPAHKDVYTGMETPKPDRPTAPQRTASKLGRTPSGMHWLGGDKVKITRRDSFEDEVGGSSRPAVRPEVTTLPRPSKSSRAGPSSVLSKSVPAKVAATRVGNNDTPTRESHTVRKRKGIGEIDTPQKGTARHTHEVKRTRLSTSEQHDTTEQEVYVINPEHNNGIAFAYHSVQRKKEDRAKMAGEGCECCAPWFKETSDIQPQQGMRFGPTPDPQDMIDEDQEILQLERQQKLMNSVSRHKAEHEKAPTPPGYWKIGFPTTQEVAQQNIEADNLKREKLERQRREAQKEGGKWQLVRKS